MRCAECDCIIFSEISKERGLCIDCHYLLTKEQEKIDPRDDYERNDQQSERLSF